MYALGNGLNTTLLVELKSQYCYTVRHSRVSARPIDRCDFTSVEIQLTDKRMDELDYNVQTCRMYRDGYREGGTSQQGIEQLTTD